MFAYLPASRSTPAGFAVVTDHFVCLLGSAASPGAARELYRALDPGNLAFETALDVVTAAHPVDDFAIVELLDAATRSVRVAVRGSISIDFGGSSTTRLSGSAGATWITGEAGGVTTLHLAVDGGQAPGSDDEGDALPIWRGVVPATVVMLDGAGASAPAEVPVPSTATVPISLPRLEQKPLEQKPTPQKPAAKARPSTKAKAKPKPKPKPEADRPSNGRQAERVDLSGLAAEVEDRRLRVRLPDGNELNAVVPVVLGRRPWSAEFDTQSSFHVSVPSPRREVSGMHLELAEVDGRLVARDLNSTNGTIVLSAERAPRLLDGGRTTALNVGDVLDIGEGFAIEVVGGTAAP